MKTDDLLTGAATRGLGGLTLYPTQDGRWQASTTKDRQSWAVHIHADPIAAVQAALSGFAAPAVSDLATDNGDIFG